MKIIYLRVWCVFCTASSSTSTFIKWNDSKFLGRKQAHRVFHASKQGSVRSQPAGLQRTSFTAYFNIAAPGFSISTPQLRGSGSARCSFFFVTALGCSCIATGTVQMLREIEKKKKGLRLKLVVELWLSQRCKQLSFHRPFHESVL